MAAIDLDKGQWQQLKAVLTQALKLSSNLRVEMLDRALANSPALREHALEMLEYYDQASKPFDLTGRIRAGTDSRAQGTPETTIEAGESLGHYRIIRKLGEGGMGIIYLAEDERLGRRVALKFLSPSLRRTLTDSNGQLLAESRSAAVLNHPGIVTVHDVFESRGELVAVMEYVEGRPLRELIVGEPLPLGFALRLGGQLAEALAYAHGRGIIHCDLKPANIHVLPNASAKILDFGLARTLVRPDELSNRTENVLFGTPGYMSPERLLGRRPTAAADVYALGVVLYELLTGNPPFPLDDEAQLFLDTLMTTPPSPAVAVASVPAAVNDIVVRCLAKDSKERPQPHECARVLNEALQVVELGSTPAKPLINRGAIDTEPGAPIPGSTNGPRPEQHYVIADDGVRITYAIHGEGPPLIFVRGWMSHLDLMWDDIRFRQYMEILGRRFTVIRYDARGNGLSERAVKNLDLNSLVLDLEALVDQLELKRFVLYASTFGGLMATVYAARHPDRVESLILEGCYARGSRITTKPRKLFLLNAFRVFPEAAFLLLSYATNPGTENATPRRPETMQQMITPAVAAKLYSLALNADISSEAAKIGTRTLVIHRRESHSIPVNLGRELSSLIPDSVFVALSGHAHNLWEGDAAAALDEIQRFLAVDLGCRRPE